MQSKNQHRTAALTGAFIGTLSHFEILFALMLPRLGLLDFNFLVKQVARHPGKAEIPAVELWLVIDGNVKKWACLSCPGGCGVQISLSLNPERRPRMGGGPRLEVLDI